MCVYVLLFSMFFSIFEITLIFKEKTMRGKTALLKNKGLHSVQVDAAGGFL